MPDIIKSLIDETQRDPMTVMGLGVVLVILPVMLLRILADVVIGIADRFPKFFPCSAESVG